MKRIGILLLGLSVIAFANCNKDGNSRANFGEPTEAIITLQAPATKALNGTEEGTPAENKISSLEFYIFDDTGSTLDPAVGTGNGYIKASTNALQQTIKLSAGDAKKMIVVANMDLGAPSVGDTYASISKKLSEAEFKASTTENNTRETPADGFEMSGFKTDFKITANKQTNQVYVNIARLVAKINAPILATDVPVVLNQDQIKEVWGDATTITPADPITFTFQGYAVVNGVSKSTVLFTGNASGDYKFPSTKPWDTWVAKTHLNSTFVTEDGPTKGLYTCNYSGKGSADWFLNGKESDVEHRVYAFESKPDTKEENTIQGYDPLTVYSYVIKGDLTAKGVTKTRYWRVNLGSSANDIYHVMRNCVYKVTVNKIVTPGYETPEEAEKPIIVDPDETAVDFVINVLNWDINEETTEM